MEKNKKDKKKSKLQKKDANNNNGTQEYPFGLSIFEYDELTMVVLLHLSKVELLGVRIVCKKWNALVYEPTIWKGVLLNTFEPFIGKEYRDIIKASSGADLLKALKDPVFARTLFKTATTVDPEDSAFDLPDLLAKSALFDRLLSDKPIWRAPWLTNNKCKTNAKLFLLPTFQSHSYPAADSLFTHVFFSATVERVVDSRDLWVFLTQRAKDSPADRPKVVATICNWLANYNWKKKPEVDTAVDQFLATATSDERTQIEHARYLGTCLFFDWQTIDQTYRSKLDPAIESSKINKANIKAKVLQFPISMVDIPPREMAKQIALCEQRHFREHVTLEYLSRRGWDQTEPVARFNKIASSLTFWIFQQPTYNMRVEAISYLYKLSYELLQMRCINGVMMMITAVNMAAVFRLLSTRKARKKCAKEVDEVERITTPAMGYKALRNFLTESIDHVVVPYMGITLSDLTFTEEGLADSVEDLINFKKSCQSASIICNILQYQFVPYLYEPVESVQQLWEDFAKIQQNVDEFYNYSLAILPPGAEKETDNYWEDNSDSEKYPKKQS